jgi:hypothetical protein
MEIITHWQLHNLYSPLIISLTIYHSHHSPITEIIRAVEKALLNEPRNKNSHLLIRRRITYGVEKSLLNEPRNKRSHPLLRRRVNYAVEEAALKKSRNNQNHPHPL